MSEIIPVVIVGAPREELEAHLNVEDFAYIDLYSPQRSEKIKLSEGYNSIPLSYTRIHGVKKFIGYIIELGLNFEDDWGGDGTFIDLTNHIKYQQPINFAKSKFENRFGLPARVYVTLHDCSVSTL